MMKRLPTWTENYLSILGLRQETPSHAYLEQLCHAHLTTFPFENISKLLYFRDKHKNSFVIPPVETLIQNFNTYHFGGTCYTLNSNLHRLLEQLGFDCHLVMLGNEHMGIIVELQDERVYVDCGAAAPIFKPVRFESDPNNVSQFADDKIHLLPVNPENGHYKYVRYTQGKQNGKDWEFNSNQKCELQDFQTVIEKSNEPGTTFMKILRCQLWQLDRGQSVSLVNNQFSIRYLDGKIDKHTLNSVAEIEDVIANEFYLPKIPVREAIDILDELGIQIFSSEE